MSLLPHYLVAYALLCSLGAAALPQEITTSGVSRVVTSPTPTRTSVIENEGNCDFKTINDFFDYANNNGLNITAEVQKCQNLCLLTYGVGNPDLSGIGVSSQTKDFSIFSSNIAANRLYLLLI
jgi:hypothetical protein